MALKTPLSSVQDVRNWREEIYSSLRDDARILAMIFRADGVIRSRLSGLYTLDEDLEETTAWNGPPLARLQMNEIEGNAGSLSLLDVTPSAAAITQQWTITFTSATEFSVSGCISGSQGTGNTSSNFTSTNSQLIIPSANWKGASAVSGDEFFVSVYKHKPLVVALSSMIAAYYTSSEIFRGTEGVPTEVQLLKNDSDEILDKLSTPYEDGGMRLDSFSERDITPEGVAYTISASGHDVSYYANNEQTPWVDSQIYSFISGPVWLT
jgi:hypothetical protein